MIKDKIESQEKRLEHERQHIEQKKEEIHESVESVKSSQNVVELAFCSAQALYIETIEQLDYELEIEKPAQEYHDLLATVDAELTRLGLLADRCTEDIDRAQQQSVELAERLSLSEKEVEAKRAEVAAKDITLQKTLRQKEDMAREVEESRAGVEALKVAVEAEQRTVRAKEKESAQLHDEYEDLCRRISEAKTAEEIELAALEDDYLQWQLQVQSAKSDNSMAVQALETEEKKIKDAEQR